MKRSKTVQAEIAAAKGESNGAKTPTVKQLQAAVDATETKIKATKAGRKLNMGERYADTKVEANVDNVAAGKVKPATKTTKKAAKKNGLASIFGFSVCSVARALGLAGFKPQAAVDAIHSKVPTASKLGIRTFVQAGRHGLRGAPAKLTKAQLKEMQQAAAEAAAFAARPTSTGQAA